MLLTAFAETAALLGERGAAEPLYELTRPYAGLYAAAGHAQAFMGSMSSALGVLAGLAGWDERADDHFADAVRAADRVESPLLAARARLYWARALASRERGNEARTGRLLWEALQTARSLGMDGLVAAAERLLGALGGRRRRGSG